ncbi:ATP-binding protein [Rugosimonospora africana]|uniref:Histidine kinase/HSP90-like ATPase domain-containing protein n=1 Tax=Rugosimonospora africana TaxID=556532 RepID=A0A8J3QRM1_9ACTN|nr:ATP-binding protein [Rugosimonospora africana]GIH15618.1 hypothetical protein Raf01_37900 [Rugosimonospora africana]
MYVDSGELSAVAGAARFTVEDLPVLRAFVARAARSAGLDTDRTDQFTLAVNEAATNAIRYATGWAEVTFRRGGGWLSVEIGDDGPGLPTAGRAAGRPPPTATHGRGFWLMDELCDRVEVLSGPSGTRISLAMAVETEPVRAEVG